MKRIITTILFLLSINFLSAQTRLIHSYQTDTYGGPSKSIKLGNILIFSAYDSIHGRELWRTDGTVAGTYILKDINPGIANGIGDYFELTSYDMNGILYFRGDDGITGIELWRSDGTETGTYLVKDLSPGLSNSSMGYMTELNNILYFTNNAGSSLWKSDGTDAGTSSIRSFSVVSDLCAFNGNLYFSADAANTGQELWKYSPSNGNCILLKDINGAQGASLPCNFYAGSNELYFTASTNDGWELWKTTGTNASTQIVKDINPNGNGIMDFYSDIHMLVVGDTIYFRAQDGVHGYQFWKSDGTVAGTVQLSNLTNGVDQYCTFPVVNGKILLNNYAVTNFWQYDPADASITETAYPSFFYFNNYDTKYIFNGSMMCYAGGDSIYGSEMWRADGSLSGNKRIQETNLTDNYSFSTSQGFNTIKGSLGNDVFFTLARNPYNTEMPLFAYDVTATDPCFPPGIIVPVPFSGTEAYFVWNRIENATNYEFQYRISGTSTWTTKNSSLSFCYLPNLNPNTDYEYRIRAFCNGNFTSYSDIAIYNSGFISDSYDINILAERCENDTTVRIYWLQSSQLTNIQIRYRQHGTTVWTTINSNNGAKRITGLLPNTFYEYEYRDYSTGSSTPWTSFLHFFVTENIAVTGIGENEKTDHLKLYPNPANDYITLTDEDIRNIQEIKISDISGRMIKSLKQITNKIDVSDLTPGIYLLNISAKDNYYTEKIVVQ